MSDNVVLSASIRANLLSLQGTNSLMNKTQLNLSTGKKVNSPLDNAVSFFTAKSLTDRASDLNSLLDSMGQSISGLNQASTSATSLTKLVDQANSIANQARDALAKGSSEAKVTGTVDLRKITDVSSLTGATATSQLQFTLADKDGNKIDLDTTAAGVQNTVNVDFAASMSIDSLVAAINAIDVDAASPVLTAKLNDSGQLEIAALNGARLSINFVQVAATPEADTNNLAFATALGFGTVAHTVADGTLTGATQNNDVRVSTVAAASLSSVKLYNYGSVAKGSDLLTALSTDVVGANRLINATTGVTSNDALVVGVDGGTTQSYAINDLTIDGLITKINGDFSGQLEATFDSTTGQINIRTTNATIKTIQFGVHNANQPPATP